MSFYTSDKSKANHLAKIREFEILSVLKDIEKGSTVLEIGAGAGWQSKILAENGLNVYAIDLKTTNYKEQQIYPVMEYDGYKIPFEDKKFDVVFSSNVLEHILHLEDFSLEMQRVLKDEGKCIHLLPSSQWRVWTILTELLTFLWLFKPHGEHAKNVFHEISFFSKKYWDTFFEKNGFCIHEYKTNELFYTGVSMLDYKMSIEKRHKLSKWLGSSCHYYILKKSGQCAE